MHWDNWRSRKEESHIRRHQEAEHGGDGAPKFIMRVVKFSKTALSRQIGEAVRIGRRGGAGRILNSKSEYNRCKIPGLVIEEVDEEQQEEEEARELQNIMELLRRQEEEWGSHMTMLREQEIRETRSKLERIEEKIGSSKREKEQKKGATRKKLKYDVEEESWGEEQPAPKFLSSPPSIKSRMDGLGSSTPPPVMQPQPPPPPLPVAEYIPEPPPPPLSEVGPGSSKGTPTTTGNRVKLGSRRVGAANTQKSILEFTEQKPPEPAGIPSTGEKQLLLRREEDRFEKSRKSCQGAGSKSCQGEHTVKQGNNDEITGSTVHYENQTEDETVSTTPSVGENQNPRKCEFDRKGFCKSHNQQAKKMKISSQKWRDRGGGRGFGYVTIKSTKFICKPKIEASLNNSISKESRNLSIDKPECEEIILTGLVGPNYNQGGLPESANSMQERIIMRLESGSADGD